MFCQVVRAGRRAGKAFNLGFCKGPDAQHYGHRWQWPEPCDPRYRHLWPPPLFRAVTCERCGMVVMLGPPMIHMMPWAQEGGSR